MAPKRNKQQSQKKQSDNPKTPATREPIESGTVLNTLSEKRPQALPAAVPVPTTSKSKDPYAGIAPPNDEPTGSCWRRFLTYLYNRENRTYCDRTFKSWIAIVVYSIMYLIFLTTFMLIALFSTLCIIKSTVDFKNLDKAQMLTYSEHGIGLTVTPTSESSYPLIWYRNGKKEDYEKYIKSIDRLLLSRKTRDTNLGQCGVSPYGYGSAPCVIIRINKQLKWTGKALSLNSTLATNVPKEVKDWLRSGRRMLWLHCGGYHPYDKEHIGSISYYPNPPGFDPSLFPLDVRNDPPLVAVQFPTFTRGVSLAIQCKLWHEHGPSSVEFIMYVDPHRRNL